MSEYCIHIPDETYREILDVTGGNRELTTDIWSLYKSQTSRELFGFREGMSGIDVLLKLNEQSDLHEILGDESFSRFVSKYENTDTESFGMYSQAQNKQSDILKKYNGVIPVIHTQDGQIKIEVRPEDESSKTMFAKQKALESLNGKLLDYIEQLGFSVREVDNLETPGTFCPSDAETNANGLKEAILISKGKLGLQALPEEVAHLLVEGFQKSPFMQRLMNSMNEDIIAEILGEQYEQYYKNYKGNYDLMRKEAVGRLVAQHLVDRNGIGDEIRFISDKMLNKMRDNLRNGNEREIDDFLRQMNEDIEHFVESTFGNPDSIEIFDNKAVSESKTKLDHLETKTRSLQDLAEKGYNVTAKRMKLLSLKNKDMKLSKDELLEFNKLKTLMEQQDYANSCIEFVKYSLNDCKDAIDKLLQLREDSKKGKILKYNELRVAARLLRQAEDMIIAYKHPMQSMSAIDSIDEIQSLLPQEQIDNIRDLAMETTKSIADIESMLSDLRTNVLFKLLQRYWGNDKVINLSNGDKKTITLEEILESCVGETFSLSRLLNSLADAGDPFLQLMDTMYKDFTNRRDLEIFELQQRLAAAQKEYLEASGSRDTKILFVRDENGKFTGMLKSDIDFLRFHREKSQYRKELKDKGLSYEEIKRDLKIWDLNHTELINVAPEGMPERFERMPMKSIYKSNDLDSLTKPQRDLYDKIIRIKKELDYLLPSKYTHLYRAPMKKGSVQDQVMSGSSIKGIWNRIKSRYITDVPGYREENGSNTGETEFGEETQTDQSREYGESVQIDQYKDGKHVVLDFSGKEVKKIPVFYTKWLDDMSALDTNLIDTMLSYGAMAYNYRSMNDISDFMELGNSKMQDRNIVLKQGASRLFERFKLGDTAFQHDYVIPGRNSQNAKALQQYIDRNVYGLGKNKETITIKGKEINVGNIADFIKEYNSLVGLGLNIFSGTTNLTMGIALTMIQCMGGRYFKLKNVLNANKNYFQDLPNGMIGLYQDVKKDKLNLLIQRFDCLEEYYKELDSNNFYGGIYKKIAGKWNPMIFNSMGEHYLHSIAMLAVLDKKKVKHGQNGELISLYEALDPIESSIKGIDGKEEKIYKLGIPEDLLNEDGTKFTEADITELKRVIQDVNHKMHGAYNDVDRGELNRWCIGRMLIQFRQWMPAFYTQRFQRERINIVTGETEEGFYRTYANFVFGIVGDAFKLKFNILTRFRNLTDMQKSNVRMALLESGLAIGLMFLMKAKFMAPEKDDPALVNIAKYNLYRLKMELGAAAPTTLDFYDNANTLIRTPLPAAENLDRITELLDLTLIGSEIKSGRYKGWNRYLRNLYFATPTAKNIGRFIDLIDGDVSMFNPYMKKK